MKRWISSQNRKVHQRRINYYMRKMNKNVERDSLWRGRFIIRQDSAQWVQYEDHSGWELYVILKLIDKKTGRTRYYPLQSVNSLSFLNGYKIWEMMNTFIVEDCNVWEVEGHEALYNDKTDWTKVKI